MAVKLLYMNQGGAGDWGTLPYGDYDILCLAESTVIKKDYTENYNSNTQPPMSVQTTNKYGGMRLISEVKDLDLTAREVRPILTFQITGINVRVVFSHLKSGNEQFATDALGTAISNYLKVVQDNKKLPTLWIGDFNRALIDELAAEFKDCTELIKGGGIAKWNLDRAYCTGDWSKLKCNVKKASVSGDNQHIGIVVNIDG